MVVGVAVAAAVVQRSVVVMTVGCGGSGGGFDARESSRGREQERGREVKQRVAS